MAGLGYWAVGVAAFLLNAAACSLGNSCPDIGCGRLVSLTIVPGPASWQEGDYALELTLDERKTQCAFAVSDAERAQGSYVRLDCRSGVGGYLYYRTASTNDFVVQLEVFSLPKTLKVVLAHDETVILSSAPALDYTEHQPAGPDCNTCRRAAVELTLDD